MGRLTRRLTGYSSSGNTSIPLGTVSSGTKTLNAKNSHYSYSTAGDHTLAFEGFSASNPEILIEIEVTAETTISFPIDAVVANDSASNLSAMAVGTYKVWVDRLVEDDDYNYSIFVGNVT